MYLEFLERALEMRVFEEEHTVLTTVLLWEYTMEAALPYMVKVKVLVSLERAKAGTVLEDLVTTQKHLAFTESPLARGWLGRAGAGMVSVGLATAQLAEQKSMEKRLAQGL
jgi:hypothetical protein